MQAFFSEPVNNFFKRLTVFFLFFLINSCSNTDKIIPPEESEKFIKYAVLPERFSFSESTQSSSPLDEISFQAGFYDSQLNAIFVGTSKGIFRLDFSNNSWSRAGLENKIITALYRQPVTGKYFASIGNVNSKTTPSVYFSTDKGASWTAANTSPYNIYDSFYEPFSSFTSHPLFPNHIFATTAEFVISKDGGVNWQRNNYEKETPFGYEIIGNFIADGSPYKVYFGAEQPLDVAFLGAHNIDTADPVLISPRETIISSDIWSNKRPNSIEFFPYVKNTLYVGQEGALSKVVGNNSTFIWLYENNRAFPGTYVRGIWVNPNNTKHILFGGFPQLPTEILNFYETFDEGKNINLITDNFGLVRPKLFQIVATNDYPALIIAEDNSPNESRLLVVKYKIK